MELHNGFKLVSTKEIESLINNLPKKKAAVQNSFTNESCQTLNEEILVFYNLAQTRGNTFNS